jgi:hypothetical protein
VALAPTLLVLGLALALPAGLTASAPHPAPLVAAGCLAALLHENCGNGLSLSCLDQPLYPRFCPSIPNSTQ